jgi:peptide chain release factor 2
MAKPGFWDDQDKAQKVMTRLKSARGPIDDVSSIEKDITDCLELLELAGEEDDEILGDVCSQMPNLQKRMDSLELKTLLNGPDDASGIYFTIHAGAGGTDAADWAEILYRMYTRFFEQNGYSVVITDYNAAEEAGIKRVTMEVTGDHAFGYLKSEIGVHRLVRISPFDAANRRHTSFSSVDVTPIIEDAPIEIDENELRIDTYRAGGAGGQHVNTTDSAVRITHLPSGIVAQCQNERSQHMNKRKAMEYLKSKLYQAERQKRDEALAKLYGDKGEIAWGNQIRSYVQHPYTLVKDHRTGVEFGNVSAVLDGELERFIQGFLSWKDRKY